MKFSIESNYLKTHLDVVNRVIAGSKSTMTILEHALFEINGMDLRLTGMDKDTRVTTSLTLASKEGEDTSFCVLASQLLSPLREMPNEVIINFELNEEGELLECTYPNGTFSFPVLPGDEFADPEPLSDDATTFKIPAQVMVDALQTTSYGASMDELRPLMTGVHVDVTPEHLSVVTTNGFLLVLYRNSVLDLDVPERTQMTIPRKPSDLLKTLFGQAEEDEEMTIEVYHNYAIFRTEKTELQCRLLDGKYPNYETVIPKDNNKIVTADRMRLLAATSRVRVFSEQSLQLVRFHFGENKLTLKASDISFNTNAEETVEVSYTDEETQFAFRAEHIVQTLRAMQTDEIEMKIGDTTRAAVISPINTEVGVEITVAVMPLIY